MTSDGKEMECKVTGATVFEDKTGHVIQEFVHEGKTQVYVVGSKSPDGWEALRIKAGVQDVGEPGWTTKPRTNLPPKLEPKKKKESKYPYWAGLWRSDARLCCGAGARCWPNSDRLYLRSFRAALTAQKVCQDGLLVIDGAF